MHIKIKRLLGFLGLISFLISISVTVYLVSQKQEVRKKAVFSPNLPDLDVTLVERIPRFNFDGEQKWPNQGEVITFIAHIKNNGTLPSSNFNFEWLIDDNPVASGTHLNLAPQEETTKTYQWNWAHSISPEGKIQGSHTLEFRVDPSNQVQEISEVNNRVKDYTQALSIGFWAERSLYDFFNQNQFSYCQDKTCAGSNSWEDWAQRQIKEWNRLFETANPQITTKVRLDKIVVVDNCALPLAGGWASNTPDMRDKTVDLMWGFTSGGVTDQTPCGCQREGGNCNFYRQNPDFQNLEHPLMHELSHARNGLPDQYGLNVYRDKDIIEVTDDNGQPAWSYFPPQNQIYANKTQDIMDHPGNHFYKDYNIYALNSFTGERNRCTNYNPNHCWPLVTSNLPQQNVLRILDARGSPLPAAKVKIFQMQRHPGFYAKRWDNIVDFEGTTDNQGRIEIGHNPFGGNNPECGNLKNPNECLSSNNWLLLLMIKAGSQTEFQFFEYTEVNLASWRGNTTQAIYPIATKLSAPILTPTPTRIPTPTPGMASLGFSIRFQGITTRRPNKTVTLILKQGTTVRYQFNNLSVSSSANGVYTGTVSNLLPGTYDLYLKGWVHLQKKFGNVSLNPGTNTQNFSDTTLKTGDAVNNNQIDIYDYNRVVEHFGPRMPPDGSVADFDLDGDVDIFDYNYLVGNFGQAGD